jgi:hypothetical protein
MVVLSSFTYYPNCNCRFDICLIYVLLEKMIFNINTYQLFLLFALIIQLLLVLVSFKKNREYVRPKHLFVLISIFLSVLTNAIYLYIKNISLLELTLLAPQILVILYWANKEFTIDKSLKNREQKIFDEFVKTSNISDNLINQLMAEIVRNKSGNDSSKKIIEEKINYAYKLILYEIENICDPDKELDLVLSLSKPINQGKFKVLASVGLPESWLRVMEKNISYSKKGPKGIQGVATINKTPIFIPDLSDEQSVNEKLWVQTNRAETKTGSMLAIPIIMETHEIDSEVLAVLTITTKNRISKEQSILQTLNLFTPKISLLIHISELIERNLLYYDSK